MASEGHDRLRWHIEDMLAYAREAVRIFGGRDLKAIEEDRTSQLAVIRCLEILGEAANRIPAETRAGWQNIPWKEIISTRHRLVHGYDFISLEVVLAILEKDLPDLIPKLEAILSGLPEEDG